MTFNSASLVTTKDPSELVPIIFNFTAQLGTGETIVSALIIPSVQSGTDPTPSNIINGAVMLNVNLSSQVTQWVHNGISGVLYHILCNATTSTGQILALACLLPVKSL